MSGKEASAGNILLLPGSPAAAKRALNLLGGCPFAWAYLGVSIDRLKAVEAALKGAGERIPFSRAVQAAARRIRRPYIDYIGGLAPEDPDSDWWLSAISEKNPMISQTYISLCFEEAFERMAKDRAGGETLAAFVERPLVLKGLCERLGLLAPKENSLAALSSRAVDALREARARRRLAEEGRERARLARKHFPNGHSMPDADKPLTVVLNWIYPRFFDEAGRFRDGYFGSLFETLREAGETPVLWPFIVEGRLEEALWSRMAGCGVPMLLSETGWKQADIEESGKRPPPTLVPPAKFPLFEGRDISDYLRADCEIERRSTRNADNRLFFSCIARWKEAGLRIKKLIYTFENHVWERQLCRDMRRHFPDIILIGAQHARLPELLLNYFISEREGKIMPLPDRLTANGAASERLLRESGYPSGIIFPGPAFRFEALASNPASIRREERAAGAAPLVVAAASIDFNESMELFDATLEAFGGEPGVAVLFKCHPAMRIDEIYGRSRRLPEHIQFCDEPFAELLARAAALVYTTSTACIEALPLCIPIVHLLVQSCLDADPLEAAPQFRGDAADGAEIRQILRPHLFEGKAVAGNREERISQIRDFFNPVAPETLKPYLD